MNTPDKFVHNGISVDRSEILAVEISEPVTVWLNGGEILSFPDTYGEGVVERFRSWWTIPFRRLATLKAAVGLECKGMRRRGRSAYAIAKETYGLKGNRESVYRQLCDMVERAISSE